MISENSIQEVRDAVGIVEVAQRYVADLKKKGANWQGCCPFHDEKSPSFTVSETKGFYKCFGCGVSGDAVKIVMERENMDFPTAIRYLAGWFNIDLVESLREEDAPEKIAQRADYLKVNARVAKLYQKKLMELADGNDPVVQELLFNRRLTEDTIISFQIGYAPDEWRFITPLLLENGLYKPAEDLGLVKTSNDTNYDIYRNRIIFPIHNERGEITGFGGRKMEDNNRDNPKYINSRESMVYKKDTVLYGLYQAAAAIRKMKFAVIVEGYFDVTGFHQTGMPNTVAPCGTALTENHAKLLKKYTDRLVLMFDNDEDPKNPGKNAGLKAGLKAVDMLLKFGFKVDICPLPEGHDPHSFSREFEYEEEIAA